MLPPPTLDDACSIAIPLFSALCSLTLFLSLSPPPPTPYLSLSLLFSLSLSLFFSLSLFNLYRWVGFRVQRSQESVVERVRHGGCEAKEEEKSRRGFHRLWKVLSVLTSLLASSFHPSFLPSFLIRATVHMGFFPL